jgi:cytochrome c-type biogenesis protein CcmH
MTIFLLCIAALLLIALAFVLPPLLRSGNDNASWETESAAASVAVLRDHLRELDADLARGAIGPQAHALAREELTRRVAEDSRLTETAAQSRAPRWSPMLVALLVPVGAMALYVLVGTPDALIASPQQAHGPQSMESAVDGLAKRLESDPDNAEGWDMLARSYNALERYDAALQAYAHLARLRPQDAGILADYADTMAMVNNRSLLGAPEQLLARALAADPDHPKALALAGTAAFEKKDFQGAIARWERIMHVVPPESELAQTTTTSISEAKRLLHGGTAPMARGGGGDTRTASSAVSSGAVSAAGDGSGAGGVSGRVDIDPALRTLVSEDDTVFIFAREAGGPPAPLAAIRRRVADLPYDFRLDDSAAMTSGRKLSGAAHIIVGARISRSGNALDRQSALEALSEPMQNGANGVQLRIAQAK